MIKRLCMDGYDDEIVSGVVGYSVKGVNRKRVHVLHRWEEIDGVPFRAFNIFSQGNEI